MSMPFGETATYETLSQQYGSQFKKLDIEQQLEFYQNLSYDDSFKIKLLTTQRIGYGFNKIVINEDKYRLLNKSPFLTFKDFSISIMKKFFEKPTQLSLKESDQSEDNSLFNDFKDSLKLSILPPQGICLACVVNDNFVVPNIIELTALLSIIVERRFKYNTKLLFPVDIQTNMQGDIINLESIPIFNQKQTDTIEYLSLQYGMFIKTQQGCLMSTIWKEAKRISSTISQDIIFSGIEKQESLMDYMLDPYYNVELDDQMWTGWIVINGYIDWDKDLFDHPQNWQELLLLIQQFTQYGDEQFNQIIANTLGKKYLNGW